MTWYAFIHASHVCIYTSVRLKCTGECRVLIFLRFGSLFRPQWCLSWKFRSAVFAKCQRNIESLLCYPLRRHFENVMFIFRQFRSKSPLFLLIWLSLGAASFPTARERSEPLSRNWRVRHSRVAPTGEPARRLGCTMTMA